MTQLPVDLILPELLNALATDSSAVLVAPPGSGKTSRVPLALLDSHLIGNGSIIMLQPRRIATVNAAAWMARSLGEEVGETVGYAIRFDRRISKRTRIEIVTEGILSRRLQGDPSLENVNVVIFDEFHERSLDADIAMALCLDVQQTIRPDLKIIVMSATLESETVARLLDGAKVFRCEGSSFPLTVKYCGSSSLEIHRQASQAVIRALRETEGDILVFLPGAGEILRCKETLKESLPGEILVCTLYGDLPFADQERAIMPASQRKVVLATNIAETSLTIEGVSVVIDSGFARSVRYSPATGMNSMTTRRISRASSTQRAGRAGRLGPGTCYRLWSEAEQGSLLPFDPPEIRVADLTPLALELANWGVADPLSLKWLDPPSPGSLAESRSLLQLLGAVDNQGHITALGRRMAGLPLHPRIARILAAATERGSARNGCDLAAILEERDIFRSAQEADRPSTACDYLDRLEALNSWRKKEGGMYDRILDIRACKQVDRSAERLRRFFDVSGSAAELNEDEVSMLLAAGFPDRIGRQREKGSNRYLLANGTGARLGSRSALNDRQYIVAVEVVGGAASEGTIHSASAISLEAIRNLFSGGICTVRRVEWDAVAGRVTATEEEMLGRLVLSERSVVPGRDEAADLIIGVISRDPGLSLLPWSIQCRQFIARASLAGRVAPEWGIPVLTLESLRATLDQWLAPSLSDVRSRTDLDRIEMLPLLQGLCTWQQLRILDDEIPTHLKVPSGSRLPLDYSTGEPVLSVKLQELFGMGDTPTVAAGRVPVLLHLLSPARRPIQVTRDLHSFWNSTYQQVKKELKGRYPRHPWPDDPWNAVPTARTNRR